MNLVETPIADLLIVEPRRFDDERGFFARTWDVEAFGPIAQDGIAFNHAKHTLRGMHWQAEPHGEVKHVRCTRGAIWDVAVDLRPGSPTRLRWHAVELSADNRRALHIPAGFAHGYLTLTADAEVHYLMSVPYEPTAGRGARWDDPAFAIDWPATPAVINDRDATYPDYAP